ncbi:uncharacterized protein LOC135095921 [Scylla paramamosain]|uniref:uncharacterized protein LOC135095921 n=1 Tax=Scylla paramamosain TaxID=85552 RepID=UPI00308301EA
MVGPYPSLPREVAATVPRRAPLRHSWVREDPLSHPSHPSHPAPLKVEVSPYSPAPQDTPSTPGHVSRARALFESPQDMHPSSPRRKDTPGYMKDTPKMSLNTTEDEAVTPVTPKNTFVTPFTPDTATKITLRVHPYIYTHPAPSRRYTQGPPLVDEFGELITTPVTPQRLMTVKKVTPIIIPRITPVRTSPQPVSHQETPQLASPQCTHAPQHCTPPRAQTTGTWDVGGDWGRGRGDEVGRTARTQQTNSTSVPKTVYRATPPPRHPHALPIAMLESPPTSHPPFTLTPTPVSLKFP